MLTFPGGPGFWFRRTAAVSDVVSEVDNSGNSKTGKLNEFILFFYFPVDMNAFWAKNVNEDISNRWGVSRGHIRHVFHDFVRAFCEAC